MTPAEKAIRSLSILVFSALLAVAARAADHVTFTASTSHAMVAYLERAGVPPVRSAPTETDYSIESASCSPETIAPPLPGEAEGTAIECRLYLDDRTFRDRSSYEGGVELITILGEVNGAQYGDLVSATDIDCKVTRPSADAPLTYACTAASANGEADRTSDN